MKERSVFTQEAIDCLVLLLLRVYKSLISERLKLYRSKNLTPGSQPCLRQCSPFFVRCWKEFGFVTADQMLGAKCELRDTLFADEVLERNAILLVLNVPSELPKPSWLRPLFLNFLRKGGGDNG